MSKPPGYRHRPLTPDEERRIVQRLQAGVTRQRVARVFRRDTHKITEIAVRHGIPIRRGWSVA